VLTGGMLGGVLLTASPASAAVTTTSTSVSATAHGSTIDVYASVSPAGGGGSISISGAGSGCSIPVGGGGGGRGGLFGGGGGGGGGGCQITGLAPMTYTLTATYTPADAADYSGSTAQTTVTVSAGPTTPVYNHQQQNNNNNNNQQNNNNNNNQQNNNNNQQKQNYNYRNYSHYAETNLSTSLYCTSPVHIGGSGSCTLWVSNSNRNFFFGPGQYNNNNYGPNYNNNFGQDFASDVTAQISLPWPLRAEYCGSYYSGCHIYGNTAYENIGNLYPGHSASLTVHFGVQPGFNIWGYDQGNPFLVIVHGSASSNHGIFTFFGRGQSSSTAYVWIRR
jgi:hypothetical protein